MRVRIPRRHKKIRTMSQNVGCFENIIGLSRTTCNCVDTPPAGYNQSTSTLFLDELDGIFLDMVQAAKDCNKGNLWDMMAWAREEGIGAAKVELLACLARGTEHQRPYFGGTIGDGLFNSNESNTGKTFAGQAWNLINAKGAFLSIKRIGTAFTTTTAGGITLNIHDDLDSTALYSIPLDTEANKLKWTTTTGIKIPLDVAHKAFKTLFFTYAVDPAMVPKEMKYSCGCGSLGGTNLWSWSHPIWKMIPEPNMRYNWLHWLTATGIKTTAGALSSSTTFSTHGTLAGLIFDIEITCETGDIICKDSYDNLDPAISTVMAHAIRYKSAAFLYSQILSTPNLTRYTSKNRQYVEDKRLEWLDEFDKRITGYLCPTLSKAPYLNKYNDCLKCKEKFPVTRGRILK